MAKEKGHPSIIAHGSKAHRGLLGVDLCEDPKRKAELEQALTVPPVVSKKKPINRDNYAPQTGHSGGDVIFDGWKRQGR